MGRSIFGKMGCSNTRKDRDEALRLCSERKRFIKQAIDSRYALAAAHVSYTQSLRNIGVSLRRFAEAESPAESSLSTSDKSPSHSSYPSPSPSHLAEISDSPLNNANGNPRNGEISPRLSYMRAETSSSVTFRINPMSCGFVEDGELEMSAPPPPPPLPQHVTSSSWDYFDTNDDSESFRFTSHTDSDVGLDGIGELGRFKTLDSIDKDANITRTGSRMDQKSCKGTPNKIMQQQTLTCDGIRSIERNSAEGTEMRESCGEREDPSEFITHRAKDFVGSIKDIEHRFFRASESGREVSRMLESNKIRVRYAETKGRPSPAALLAAFKLVCCQGKTLLVTQEPVNQTSKIITWKRTSSSRSSSSRNQFVTGTKEDVDSGSDFAEEFCMIAGSHSSTLERLYAWERKLYDEVKASESIRKEYDRKCEKLKNQFAKDIRAQVIDKTRAVAKDLHSRVRVAIQSVDVISKRIEKIRDEELQPQLEELIQGLLRMWKAMLECHHSQYITISLAYHSRTSCTTSHGEIFQKRQVLAELLEEAEYFGLSFADWVNSLTAYIGSLNGWLQNCILLPAERSRNRRPWSPRRALAPPIFVLCREWSSGINSLPSNDLSDTIKVFLSDLHVLMDLQGKTDPKKEVSENDEAGNNEKVSPSSLSSLHPSLTKLLDRLNKFSEASLKMYEDAKQKSETARVAYNSSCRPVRY